MGERQKSLDDEEEFPDDKDEYAKFSKTGEWEIGEGGGENTNGGVEHWLTSMSSGNWES